MIHSARKGETHLSNFRVHNIVRLQIPATQKGDTQTTQGDLVLSGGLFCFLWRSVEQRGTGRYRRATTSKDGYTREGTSTNLAKAFLTKQNKTKHACIPCLCPMPMSRDGV